MAEDADVIVVGGGLAGLVAATEIADAGKRVIVVDQEGEQPPMSTLRKAEAPICSITNICGYGSPRSRGRHRTNP